jgi:3-oxoacyl-[acyl-carrier protein] reductase
MDLNLKGKVFLVAGGSRGLGLGVARALAAEGALVSLGSRGEAAQSEAGKLSEIYGIKARGYSLDVTDSGSITNWMQGTHEYFGHINGLVVNGGGPPSGDFDDFGDEAWSKAFELTLLSAVRLIRAVVPALRTEGAGSILTVTSTSIKEPIPNLILSNVFRSGVSSLVKSLSVSLAVDRIRINNIVPGRIDTDRVATLDQLQAQREGVESKDVRAAHAAKIPLGRYGESEEFGKMAAFLLSDAASYSTGSTVVVDGGKTSCIW